MRPPVTLTLTTLLVACGPRREDSAAVETGLDPEPACVVPEDPETVFGDIALVETPLGTVFEVRWSAAAEGTAWVQFWPEGGEARQAPARAPGSALILGLKAQTTYDFRVVLAAGDTRLCSETASLTTGILDPALPRFERTFHDPDLASGDFVVMTLEGTAGEGRWAVILDGDGDAVWAARADPVRTWLSLDRQALLTNDRTYEPGRAARITRTPLDGSPGEELEVMDGHWDFVEVEPGVYATFGWDLRSYEEGTVTIAGETIMEVSAGQEPRVVWSVFDVATPDLSVEWTPDPTWTTEAAVWSHLNHLHYAPEEDAYYATSRGLAEVYRVDRATGETTWVLGQGGGDFTPAGAGVHFNPHSAMPTDDGVLLYDTGSKLSGRCSAISEFALDTEAWTATPAFLYHTEDCLVTSYLGNATLLDGGNRMLVLAMNGQLDEVTPAGELAWRVNVPGGWVFGYVTREASLYP